MGEMGQNIDSILLHKNDEKKVQWLLEESRDIIYSDPQLAFDYAERALAYAVKNKNLKQIIASKLGIANAYITLGQYPKAYEYITTSIELANQNEEQLLLAYGWRVLGIWYDMQGDLKNAIENYHNALTIYQKLGNMEGEATCYNNIGVMLYELNDYSAAIEIYTKSVNINLQTNNKRGLSKSYCNLGNAYEKIKEYKTALDYLTKALNIDESLDDKQGIAANLHNLGLVYMRMEELDKALTYFRRSLILCEEMNDLYRIVTRYTTISEVYNKKSDFEKGLTFALKALDLSQNIGTLGQQTHIYSQLIASHEGMKNYFNAFEAQRQLSMVKDSLFDIERAKEVAIIQTKYEVKQSQQELEKTRILAAKDRMIRNAFVAAFFLTIVLAIFIYNGYRNKLLANKLINEKNSQLEYANAEILSQRDEVESQRDMVIQQKEKLEKVNQHTTDSLRYAQSIQAAILPSEKILQQISPDYFVLMKPCELVSGDFFWATVFDEFQVFCIADCTGHGVPGAFMSILGITALNDIVVRHRISKASEILGYLRQNVIEALSQNESGELHKDGMDIALCVFNTKTRELQFAGAGLPLWLVVNQAEDNLNIDSKVAPIIRGDFIFHEIKGDNMPVGQSPITKPFKNQTIALKNQKVSLFLATDGYADQLGGDQKTKFGSKILKNLILDNAGSEFPSLLKKLDKTFDVWKGDGYQVDDVAILGIKI